MLIVGVRLCQEDMAAWRFCRKQLHFVTVDVAQRRAAVTTRGFNQLCHAFEVQRPELVEPEKNTQAGRYEA